MRFLRTWSRFLVAVQLLPALEGGEETLVGGQAVLEGVMMRSPHAWGIACRKPSGEVSVHSEPLERLSEKHKWMGWPVIRGVITLGHAMTLGFRALKFSANVALDELQPAPEPGEPEKKKFEISGWIATVNVVFSVGFFICRYLYMKIKKPTEKTTFTVAIHPLISNFFFSGSPGSGAGCNSSSATLAENFNARKPSVMAWPSVMTPRITGHPIHLCFSESRSRGSLWTETSPDGLRQAIPQAWGDRIITPSSTACPPTRVSSPPSSAGSNCTATRKRDHVRQNCIGIG